MPKKKTVEEPKIETELDVLKMIAEELHKIRKEMESLNYGLGMMASRDNSHCGGRRF